MSDNHNDRSSSDLRDIEERLRRSRGPVRKGDYAQKQRRSALGFGFRIAVDLVCAVAVGFAVGYFLDKWLGTSPWMLLLFTPLGVAAGITNVMRAAQAQEAKRLAGEAENED